MKAGIFVFLFVAVCVGPLLAKNNTKNSKAASCLELGQTGFQRGVPGPKGWHLQKPCCKPLVDREPKDIQPYGGGYSYMCIACGDKSCDPKFEDSKNCPEDCTANYQKK